MQEVFEKIIDRIKKVEDGRCPNYECWKYLNKDCGECCEIEIKIKDAIEIVKQEAEQYNNGWIPCSYRLPEEAFGCLVTVIDCNPVTLTEFENILPYVVGYDGDGWNDADGETIPFEVIAWKPLPQPYKPKGE